MENSHINESILSEEILEDQKKNRIDHMTYLPGMEDIGSDVMDQVISAMNAYDYEKYKNHIDPHPEYRITLEELIQCSTYNGAHQLNFEDAAGTIEVGKSADIVIFDCNLQEIPTDKIENASISYMIVRGQLKQSTIK